MQQQGLLTINLDPICISFLPDSGMLSTTNCSEDKLIDLLIALGFEMSDHGPPAECIVRLYGNFNIQTLASVGLSVAPEVKNNAA